MIPVDFMVYNSTLCGVRVCVGLLFWVVLGIFISKQQTNLVEKARKQLSRLLAWTAILF